MNKRWVYASWTLRVMDAQGQLVSIALGSLKGDAQQVGDAMAFANLPMQLLPVQPITIDARLPDGLAFTPLGLLRWVRGGVVVQFAPAVADLAGLANAITALLPDATLAGTRWRLVPQWVLPEGNAAQQTALWALG